MTVSELFNKCELGSGLKVMSVYNGKVLCQRFNPEKHKDVGERNVCAVWAEIAITKSTFGNIARPIMCVYADGMKEMEDDHDE